MPRHSRLLDIEVVFVCDPVEDDDESIGYLSRNADRPVIESFRMIYQGLSEVARCVVHYNNLNSVIDNIHRHRNAVVFPYWFGEISRNRHALLPAICESYGVTYVGADAYTKIVCNDKYLSKSLCDKAGLRTPKGILLNNQEDLEILERCVYPLVVKPNGQGSSLGINDDSLAYTARDAREVASRIGAHIGWPILCEEFISGREVSICLIGDHCSPVDISAISWYFNGDENFMNDRLYTYAIKYIDGMILEPISMNHVLSAELRSQCNRLFSMLDKVEVMRIDGRIGVDGFVVIELTPDLDLRSDGELNVSFRDRFSCYSDMLRLLLINALERARRHAPVDNKNEIILMSDP